MKKRLVLAACSFFLMSGTALADPISIGSAIISGLLSVGAAGILPAMSAGLLGSIVLGAGVLGAQFLAGAFFGPRAPKMDPGEFKSTFETGNSSEIRAIGRVRVGGLKAFGNTTDLDRWRVICHTKGPIAAVEEHYVGGREVTVDPDGMVTSPPWARKGGAWLYIKSKIGNGSETAWPDLKAAFPDLWTDSHRVRGIAQSLLRYISPGIEDEKFLKLYQGGEPPYERVQRSELIHDPRDASQNVENPATWKYSDNGILGATHILRSYPSLKSSDIDWAFTAQEATKADQIGAVVGGNEVRARAWGLWPSERERGDVMDQVLKSIGAEIIPTDNNKFAVRLIDDQRSPELTITARDIVDLQWKSGPDSVERPNVCRIKYYSPERNYEMAEIPLSKTPNEPGAQPLPWSRYQNEIDRVGEQYFDVELPFCPSSAQAQRIGRRLFALARADVGVVTTNFAGLAAWGKSFISLELPDLDETVTAAIGTPRINDGDGTVEIPFVVWPALSLWNVALDEAPPPDPIPDMQYEAVLDTPAKPSGYAQIQYSDGSYELRVLFSGVPEADSGEAVFRPYTSGEPDAWSAMGVSGPPTGLQCGYVAGNYSGRQVDFRARFFNPDDEGSYWSPTLSVASVAIENPALPAPILHVTRTDGGSGANIFAVNVTTVDVHARSVSWSATVNAAPVASGGGNSRPGQSFSGQFSVSSGSLSRNVVVTATAQNSAGMNSPVATYSYTIPGDGGGSG
ncbi:phage tail protein [Brucella anthropi]|uniref:phage tail protein n=1 Tax=Brucella anthropi TaxID=529 RepID=UPI00125CDD46|nr:phage tail protein [Brucella anthropi]QFP61881.1 hypothetical protein FT787_01530 [Brucella anthropi]